ncbi:MAG: translation elongation factor-like protein [Candidatus Omnitrophica bacterium]|nr:translation elongation factor-like protein [Candidatus Omnitrophota bacterium]
MFFGLFRKSVKMVKVKRKAKPKKTKHVKTKIKKKQVKIKKATPQLLGEVTHYFPHVKAGVIMIAKGTISLGDTVYIKGHTTEFKQKVSSMQIDNQTINQAKKGQEVGLSVKSRVRHHDRVYKLNES